jgi:hypothetical protein
MMDRAVLQGGRVLVIATHGPTVESTQALLTEVADEMGQTVTTTGALVETAWDSLAAGEIDDHNTFLAETIRTKMKAEEISCVVLAQLSMSIFTVSFPDPLKEFGIPVFTSGQCGFEALRPILASKS